MSQASAHLQAIEELERLRAKRSTVQDQDIRLAMDARIDVLEKKIAAETKAEAEVVEAEDENLEPPTPDQLKRADDLIRQARVEKIRNNASRALALMKEAAAIAPSAPAVLEVLGDDCMERKQWKAARDAYAKALKFAKNNVELERKHGMMVLRAQGMSMFDPAMMREGSDPFLGSASDSAASPGWAKILSLFLPGLGHLVTGKIAAGVGFIVAMIVWVVWLKLEARDIVQLGALITGKDGKPNLLVMVPILGAVVTYISAVASLGVGSGAGASKVKVQRPQPPVNLPFD